MHYYRPMRSLKLTDPKHSLLERSFEGYLKNLGYSPSVIYNSPGYVHEFLFFLEQHTVESFQEVSPDHITRYFDHLATRKNLRRDGTGLSPRTIINHLCALKRFSRYLREVKGITLEVEVSRPRVDDLGKVVLSRREVLDLYDTCSDGDQRWKWHTLGVRDRVMLGVYYGCGLRRSEGLGLDLSDVDLGKGLLYVRRGKNYKERYVPVSKSVGKDMGVWLPVRAEWLSHMEMESEQALFISLRGKRMCQNAMHDRLKVLARRAHLEKPIGLHTLRHSIATHLLQEGMSLENVSRFLGHSSLEVTQVYTHLSHEIL